MPNLSSLFLRGVIAIGILVCIMMIAITDDILQSIRWLGIAIFLECFDIELILKEMHA